MSNWELGALFILFLIVLALIGRGTWLVMGDVSQTWREGTKAKREAKEAKARNEEVIARVREYHQVRSDLDDLFRNWEQQHKRRN